MDYTKIPESLRSNVREWIKANEYSKLLKIHDEYKLTPYDYHCCNLEDMMNWYREGLRTNQI